MKHQIKHINGSVLYEADIPDDTPSGMVVRVALERATSEDAWLEGAWLQGAWLQGAWLEGARLQDAWLEGARLQGARLQGAWLEGARLQDARLEGAWLQDAWLEGARLQGARLQGDRKLIGQRPIIQLGPIGSRSDYLVGYLTDKGLMVRAGCFFGTVAEFESRCAATHGDNQHAQEYKAALAFFASHAKLWTPKEAA